MQKHTLALTTALALFQNIFEKYQRWLHHKGKRPIQLLVNSKGQLTFCYFDKKMTTSQQTSS